MENGYVDAITEAMRRQRLKALTPLNHPRPLLFGVSVAPHKVSVLRKTHFHLDCSILISHDESHNMLFYRDARGPQEDQGMCSTVLR